MKRLVLAASVAAACLSGTGLRAEGHEEAAEPQPRMEDIETRTMGGSFPVETVVTFILLGIIVAAINTDSSSGGGAGGFGG